VATDSKLANIYIQNGTLGYTGSSTAGNPTNSLIISNATSLTFYNNDGFNATINKQVILDDGGTIQNGGGANTISGPLVINNVNGNVFCTFNIGGTSLTVSSNISGNGVLLMQGSASTLVLSGNGSAFTGGVLMYEGTLDLTGTLGCGITNDNSAIIEGTGSAAGTLDVSGPLIPGTATTAGTLTAGGLILEGSSTPTFNLTSAATVGQGVNSFIQVNGNLTFNDSVIYINPLVPLANRSTYTLMACASFSGSLPTAVTVQVSQDTFTVTNVTTSSNTLIQVTVSSPEPSLLVWNNASGDGEWNVDASPNWSNATTHAASDYFFTFDSVVFNDSIASAANPSTNIDIANGQAVIPTVMTNNSTTNNYTISGAGKISGNASVVKLGSSTLNINTTNDFTGNFTIAGGAVQMNTQIQPGASGIGASNGTVYVTNGASLILNLVGGYPAGDFGFGSKPIAVSGAGVGGNGAIQNIGNSLYNDSSTFGLGQNVTMFGNTTLGGTSRWDWGYPGLGSALSTRGSNFNLTVIEPSYSQWTSLMIDTNLGNFDFYSTASSQQTWAVSGLGGSLGNPANTLTLHSNVLMNIQHGATTAGDSGYAKIIHILPTAGIQYQPGGGAGDYRLASGFVLESNSGFSFFSGNGGSGSGTVINGAVVLNGVTHVQIGDSTVTLSNVISGAGGFTWDNYNNTLAFAATNTYSGPTVIGAGRTLALLGNGSISQSSPIFFGGTSSSSIALDVSARSDQTLTLASGQTLAGIGAVNGNLVVASGATVAPAGTNVLLGITAGSSATGAISAADSVVLNGTTIMKLNGNGASDQILSASSVSYGGVLSLVNIDGPLAAGNSFKLFNASSYAGSFSSIAPASPGLGLAWNTSQLNVSGTLAVMAVSPAPVIGSVAFSAGNLVLTGSNGVPGSTFYVLAATNLTTPLTNWLVLSTNVFNANGDFSLTNMVGSNLPDEFFELEIQTP
jgi:autotransporter-associated beta strand protein